MMCESLSERKGHGAPWERLWKCPWPWQWNPNGPLFDPEKCVHFQKQHIDGGCRLPDELSHLPNVAYFQAREGTYQFDTGEWGWRNNRWGEVYECDIDSVLDADGPERLELELRLVCASIDYMKIWRHVFGCPHLPEVRSVEEKCLLGVALLGRRPFEDILVPGDLVVVHPGTCSALLSDINRDGVLSGALKLESTSVPKLVMFLGFSSWFDSDDGTYDAEFLALVPPEEHDTDTDTGNQSERHIKPVRLDPKDIVFNVRHRTQSRAARKIQTAWRDKKHLVRNRAASVIQSAWLRYFYAVGRTGYLQSRDHFLNIIPEKKENVALIGD